MGISSNSLPSLPLYVIRWRPGVELCEEDTVFRQSVDLGVYDTPGLGVLGKSTLSAPAHLEGISG